MRLKQWLLIGMATLVSSLNTVAAAQPTNNAPISLEELLEEASQTADANGIKTAVQSAIGTPDRFGTMLTTLTETLTRDVTALNLFNDFNLKLEVFDPANGEGEAALGLEYSFDKSILNRAVSRSIHRPASLSLNLHAKGNIAFDQEKNPDDFLETGASLHLFGSVGGWTPRANPGDGVRFRQLARELDLEMPEEQRGNDPTYQAFRAYFKNRLRPQFFYDVAARFSLESNQDFSDRQYAYGLVAGGVLREYNDESALARFNVLDYPFAAIRWLTLPSEGWKPSGQAIPSVLVGIDLVDPSDHETRLAIDPDTDVFPRLKAELGFKTELGELLHHPVWFSASFRYYKEFGAAAAIKAMDLDESAYVALTVEFLGGLHLTYSAGKLPMDSSDDATISLGWKFNF